MLSSPHYKIDVNEYSSLYHHTPLIACIHWNNYEAAKLLLNDPGIDVNKPELDLGWTPLHECVRFGRDEIAKLLINHPKINIWMKSDEDELPLDIGQYLGHDNRCLSLIKTVHECQYKAIQQTVPYLPKCLCKEIAAFVY